MAALLRLLTALLSMRPVAFGEALPAGTRLTLFSDDKPARFFSVIEFWLDETSGIALALKGGVPTYQVEDERRRAGAGPTARTSGSLNASRAKRSAG